MNRISLVNNKLNIEGTDFEVEYKEAKDIFNISNLNIISRNNKNLYINLDLNNTKLNVCFDIKHNINVYIMITGESAKIKFNYDINNTINVIKYNSIDSINEMIEINLNNDNSDINYIFKSIGTNKENYDYVVNHNKKYTNSNIINNCVNKEGIINIQISGYVPKDIVGCICNQNNRIINLTNNKCEIRPNLYIDTDDVDANHSALIGKFSYDEMFYLNSRGINDLDANNLLVKGFLLSNIENEQLRTKIIDDIDKYWR